MKSQFLVILSVISLLSFADLALAQESASGVSGAKSESSQSTAPLGKILENKKFEDDKTITDQKLKVDDGSLSRYSLNASLGYKGPTLNDFSTADQPNPDHKIGVYAQQATGNMSGKYRLDSSHSVAVGSGVAFNHPLSGWDRTDLNNPFVRYDIASRFGDVQMRNSPELIYSTIPNYTNVGEYGGAMWLNSLVYNFGFSRFAFELDTTFYYWAFNRSYVAKDGPVQQWSLAVSPNFRYVISDRFYATTGVAFSGWNPRQGGDLTVYDNYRPTGSFGIGFAYNRDIYFSPYLGFLPGQMTFDSTTVNFTTVFSIL